MVKKKPPHNSDWPSLSSSESKERTLSTPLDWSLLPEELLHIISAYVKDCFDAIHARSVCRSWRAVFPFPASLLRTRYSLPAFADFTSESNDLCTLEKIPVFLFTKRAHVSSPCECFMGDIGRDNSTDQMEVSSPIQCTAKVKIPGSDLTSVNIVDCQVLPLGYKYRMIGWDYSSRVTKPYQGVAFLPFPNGEFVVIVNYTKVFLVLKSTEMRWTLLRRRSTATCEDLFTFRGKFYASFCNGDIFIIDPYSLESTPLMPPQDLRSVKCLFPSGDDELFLIESTTPMINDVLYFSRRACRVSKLDEEADEWVVVTDIGDRVFFFGDMGNFSCSGKDLPDGCGVSGNSLLFTNWPGSHDHVFKYGVPREYPEDNLEFWRFSKEFRVTILRESPRFAAFRVEAQPLGN